MLLAYIEDLLDSPIIEQDGSEYSLYKALVESWLLREEGKTRIPSSRLWLACEILAVRMHQIRQTEISEKQLDDEITHVVDLQQIKDIDLKGRSLLNRNSEGNYRFSHYSFQEFLVAHFIRRMGTPPYWTRIPVTEYTLNLINLDAGLDIDLLNLIDLSGIDIGTQLIMPTFIRKQHGV
jgi:hypothetical protein